MRVQEQFSYGLGHLPAHSIAENFDIQSVPCDTSHCYEQPCKR